MNTNSKEKLNKTPRYKQAIIIFMLVLLVLPLFTWQTTLSDPGTGTPWDGSIASGFESGGGDTVNDPYIIMTATQLAHFSNNSNDYSGKYLKLGADILINEMNEARTAFTGTTRTFAMKSDFKGVLDGDGHEIIGMYISAKNDNVGMFQKISSIGAEIKNLKVSGEIKGTTALINSSSNVGGIVGSLNDGNLINCSFTGKVEGRTNVGGLAGITGSNTKIQGCMFSGSVKGTGGSSDLAPTKVGGIVGEHKGVICNSVNNGNVSGNYSIGGIAGLLSGNGAAIANSMNKGTITGGGTAVIGRTGGIAGGKSGSGYLINKNVNLGTVEKSIGTYLGSIAGFSLSASDAQSGNYSYNFYQNGTAPNAYGSGGGSRVYGDGYNYAGAPVGSTDSGYSHLNWPDLVVSDPDDPGKNYLNLATGCGCGPNGYYLDPNNGWQLTVDLDESGQPPVEMNVCITHGREYLMPTSPWEDETAITNDSVLTIAYRFGVDIGCPPSRLTLGFKISDTTNDIDLPIGTRITVMTKGVYYYKILDGTVHDLRLSTFYEMGSTTEQFQGTSWTAPEERDYLVSIDFTNVPKEDRLPEGTYDIKFLPRYATTLTEYPKMIIKEQNFEYGGSGEVNGFYLELLASPSAVDAYNHLVDGKEFGVEFYLEDDYGNHDPLPIGSKVNGVPVTRAIPYQILPFSLFERYNYKIKLPLGYEDYRIAAAYAYASENPSLPRGGHELLYGRAGITFTDTEEDDYALKTTINFEDRFLDYSSEDRYITASLERKYLTGAVLEYTLQKKYGAVYSNVSGQENQSPSISASTINLLVPGGLEKGTYRFVITLYDKAGAGRSAQTNSIENIIIK